MVRTDSSLALRRLSCDAGYSISHLQGRFSNRADRDWESCAIPKVMDLLFLGHCDAKITIALLAAFFRVTRNAALSKPWYRADAQHRPSPRFSETYRQLE